MKRLIAIAVAVGLSAAAQADLATGFEDYNASAAGTLLTGQQGWYLPVAGSADYSVFTYAGNTYNFPPNPQGGNNFVIGKSLGGTSYARTQHDHDFSAGGLWLFSYDSSAQFNGTATTADYLGSFSIQTNPNPVTLNIWNDNNNPTLYHSSYITTQYAVPGISPGPAWTNLLPNHWYRQTTLVDFSANNQILEVSIQDLTAGGLPTVVAPNGWHLTAFSPPVANGIRFFAGGANTGGGNTEAWDNLSVLPVPEPTGALLLGLAAAAFLRRR